MTNQLVYIFTNWQDRRPYHPCLYKKEDELEWFTQIYLSMVYEYPSMSIITELLVVVEAAAILLLFKRKINLAYLLLFSILLIMITGEVLPNNGALSKVSALPYRVRMLSLDTWLVIAGWILGLALLFYSLRSKTRSVSRVAVSTVLLVTCTLMYGYHLLIVQGSLNISFTEEKGRMLRVIDTEQEYWNKTCEIHEYECGTIRKDNALNYHDDIINKEINDFLSFYKEVSADPVFLL